MYILAVKIALNVILVCLLITVLFTLCFLILDKNLCVYVLYFEKFANKFLHSVDCTS